MGGCDLLSVLIGQRYTALPPVSTRSLCGVVHNECLWHAHCDDRAQELCESRGDRPGLPASDIISLMVSVDVTIVQELCESRGGRPGLSVLTSLLVSVDVKNY